MLVLIVEDDRTIALVLRLALEDAGYQVLVAGNGREALDLLSQARPALVLSDVVMPFMGGLELARLIRADPALHASPVVLMSAVQRPAAEGSYQAFIRKPFVLDDILALVARLTAASQASSRTAYG